MTSGYDSDFHDGDHLRRLLGQRAARAEIHDRFSSSEFSDSPSIYSHAYFSPRPTDRADANASTSTYHRAAHVRQPSEPRSLMTDRQRLDIPGASSLDLDDDPRNSYLSTVSNEEDEVPSDDDSATEEAGDNDTEVHRVSAYGPKMTVHSRAPWEIEDEEPEEPEEPDSGSKLGAFRFAKRDTGKKRGRDGRAAIDTRPSFDSIRSRGKQSFDTTSSHVSAGGALLYVCPTCSFFEIMNNRGSLQCTCTSLNVFNFLGTVTLSSNKLAREAFAPPFSLTYSFQRWQARARRLSRIFSCCSSSQSSVPHTSRISHRITIRSL